jgi:BMFP domain-containing protein YqiC
MHFPYETAGTMGNVSLPLKAPENPMKDSQFLNDLSDKLAGLLPKAEALGGEMKDELHSKIQKQLKSSLASLDVVSREEFDAQAAALARAEQRIAELEARVTALAE